MSDRMVDVEAERAAIGAMLLDPVRMIPLARLTLGLPCEAWATEQHRRVVKVLYAMSEDRRFVSIDCLTVATALSVEEGNPRLEHASYLGACMEACVTVEHGAYYLDLVKQGHLRRRIVEVALEVADEARKSERGDELLEGVSQRFVEILGAREGEESVGEVMSGLVEKWRRIKSGEQESGLKVPWEMLNQLSGGLEPGLTVLAARPSVGKTTVEDCIAVGAAAAGVPVGRVTLDMDPQGVLARGICRMAGVSLAKLKAGYAREDQLAEAAAAAQVLGQYPMYMTNRHRDVSMICSWARMQKVKHGIGLLTIDFAQQVQVSAMGMRGMGDANARLTTVCGVLKALSFELGIPVLLLSQLSRAIEKEGRDPQLSDLRDSGALEQDAAKVWFLYQDQDVHKLMEEYKEGSTSGLRPIWIDQMKNQNGETGRVPLWQYARYFRFEEAGDRFGDWQSKLSER
jgi:replicative DNA helicase